MADDSYTQPRPGSARLYAEALEVFPSGVTHDSRYMTPFPLYIDHAQGARKWDVDGNEYIDFVIGHGALLLGHSHPAVVEAVVEPDAPGAPTRGRARSWRWSGEGWSSSWCPAPRG